MYRPPEVTNQYIMRRHRSLLLGVISTTFVGCAVGPDYVKPVIETDPAFSNVELVRGSIDDSQIEWWKNFNDQELTGLISDAVIANKTISAALGSVHEARSNRRERTFDLFPTVRAGAGYTESESSNARFGSFGGAPEGSAFDTKTEFFSTTLDAMWELDFFGRVRRSVEVTSAQEEAVEAQLADAIRIVIAEVARNYFELRGMQQQLDVARRNATNQEKTVQLTETLFEGGRVTALDTSRARSQWQSTLATIPLMQHGIRAAIYRLGVLTGKRPTQLIAQLSVERPLPVFSGPLQLSNPGELLLRRPDLRAAERALAAATAGIGVATGDLFPKVSFAGSFGYEARTLSGLGDSGSNVYSFGPTISWAFLDLGRVFARLRVADARAAKALADYEQRVLSVLEETETALSLYGSEVQRREYLKEAVKQSRTAAELARVQYNDGMVDFLTVLDAERALLIIEDQLAGSETTAATALIGIYKSLGGGWENLQVVEDTLKTSDSSSTIKVPAVVAVTHESSKS